MSKKTVPQKGSTFTIVPKGASKKDAANAPTVQVVDVKPDGTVTVRKISGSYTTVTPRGSQHESISRSTGRHPFKGRIATTRVANLVTGLSKPLQEQTQKPKEVVRTGADLVAYWQREGLIGTRKDITDSSKYARQIREQAEQERQNRSSTDEN